MLINNVTPVIVQDGMTAAGVLYVVRDVLFPQLGRQKTIDELMGLLHACL